jgi:hypothetical protein
MGEVEYIMVRPLWIFKQLADKLIALLLELHLLLFRSERKSSRTAINCDNGWTRIPRLPVPKCRARLCEWPPTAGTWHAAAFGHIIVTLVQWRGSHRNRTLLPC